MDARCCLFDGTFETGAATATAITAPAVDGRPDDGMMSGGGGAVLFDDGGGGEGAPMCKRACEDGVNGGDGYALVTESTAKGSLSGLYGSTEVMNAFDGWWVGCD